MEDIIEELVGEIYDVHDAAALQDIIQQQDGSYRVLCSTNIDKMFDYFDVETNAAVLVDTRETYEKAAVKKSVKAPAKAEKIAPVKKAASKKAELKTEMFLQFAGKEYTDKEIFDKIKYVWSKVLKNKVGDMKDVKIYLKPEESAAYYVINGDTTGKVDL